MLSLKVAKVIFIKVQNIGCLVVSLKLNGYLIYLNPITYINFNIFRFCSYRHPPKIRCISLLFHHRAYKFRGNATTFSLFFGVILQLKEFMLPLQVIQGFNQWCDGHILDFILSSRLTLD